jgi:lipoprotein-releasing system ATP-binding protein
MAKLEVEGIVKEFPTRSGSLEVLGGISFSLAESGSLAIVGPSGSGKSTLLNIVGTLEAPTSGKVALDGRDPTTLDEKELADFRREHLGFIFQDHHLLPQCSALENVLVPCLGGGSRVSHEDQTRGRELLDRVGLSERLDHRSAELSGGERQRVAIARALIHRPSLLLADEPTGNLDRGSARQVAALLRQLQEEEGMLLLLVTHDLDLAAKMQARQRLDEGTLVEIES